MCEKAVDIYPSALMCVSSCYKTQEICKKAVSKEPFMWKFCLDKYKSQEMCDKTVNACPPLKFVLDWFVIVIRCLKILMMYFLMTI